jgi:hypothetical protein
MERINVFWLAERSIKFGVNCGRRRRLRAGFELLERDIAEIICKRWMRFHILFAKNTFDNILIFKLNSLSDIPVK